MGPDPSGYLCPPIPGRVDYIHYLADLLAESNNQEIPRGSGIKALDIGTGASLVYPLTGNSEYGWTFTGVDIDTGAVFVKQVVRRFHAASLISGALVSFSGFNQTGPAGCQFRVFPDQRCGFWARAVA